MIPTWSWGIKSCKHFAQIQSISSIHKVCFQQAFPQIQSIYKVCLHRRHEEDARHKHTKGVRFLLMIMMMRGSFRGRGRMRRRSRRRERSLGDGSIIHTIPRRRISEGHFARAQGSHTYGDVDLLESFRVSGGLPLHSWRRRKMDWCGTRRFFVCRDTETETETETERIGNRERSKFFKCVSTDSNG